MQASLFNGLPVDRQRTAKFYRDRAIARAVKAAGEVWMSQARDLFWTFCREHREFLIEEARQWIEGQGLEAKKSKRVYGGITRYAVEHGWIEKVGFGETTNPLAHGTPAGKWRSRIFRG